MPTAQIMRGLAAAPGIVIGPALVFNPVSAAGAAAAESPEDAMARLDAAIAEVDIAIAALEEQLRAEEQAEEAEIFGAHRMLLGDPSLRERAAALIVEGGMGAAQAIGAAGEEQAAELIAIGDEYLSARAADVRDVVGQVQRRLTGAKGLAERLEAPAVVVARDLGPSDLISAPRERLLGFALAAGGLTAHSTILARALGIPAVVGLGEDLLDLPEGVALALDGAAGSLHIDPPAEALARLRGARADIDARMDAMRADVGLPAVTRDGRAVALVANASTPAEALAARAWGAAGVGLLRTELLFLERPDLPGEEEQLALYTAVAAELPGAPITVRTLDVGGDKHLPAFPLPHEDNPFLGWRGLRIGLSQPEILLPQLRALLRAGAAADIRIMLPMVSTVDELRRARALLDRAREQLAEEGLEQAASPQLGVMIEVPAAALNAEALAREADFFSIGTNDLTQYTLACDRGNSRINELYQPLDPAVLRLIRMTCEAAHRHGRHVAVCGELGGDPAATALLIGLGVDELSCGPNSLPLVRAAIRAAEGAAATELADRALACASAAEVRDLLS
ncbi:phosphoenolpyruvate--protein phosphotransferase [Oscillochloris sp. ZM17-4]|uniref:phosphoenolpyruvate--protein phosphotransferase n=1 Tax=Oscillochloris sp. ZM17-4 TaxID=2866714 RepID=UPI001C737C72|nr:phosphoenolpyruvate--protein phosphotransferase [Oscillochloris sp. ZM17-4]MBX0326150.1 phosphoenolpyruvate--protein phosphotransferase [Oscillochloris sp. ZM17-4]